MECSTFSEKYNTRLEYSILPYIYFQNLLFYEDSSHELNISSSSNF